VGRNFTQRGKQRRKGMVRGGRDVDGGRKRKKKHKLDRAGVMSADTESPEKQRGK